MGKKLKCMFPARATGSDFLYLVGGHDGLIKVGRTKDARHRILTHRRRMADNFAWAHVFCQGKSGVLEYGVKSTFQKIGRQVRRTESFYGIDKATAIAEARRQYSERAEKEVKWAFEQHLRDREQAAWKAFRAQYMIEVKAAA